MDYKFWMEVQTTNHLDNPMTPFPSKNAKGYVYMEY